MLFRSLILRVSSWKWVERFVSRSRVMKGVVDRFVAGEKVEEAMKVAEDLASRGFFVTLDLLGEHSSEPQASEATVAEYQKLLNRIAQSNFAGETAPERINISIKLSQLGLMDDYDACVARFSRLIDTAAETHNFVRVDMEESRCTDRTLSAVMEIHARKPNVGVAIQSMLFRSEADIRRLNEFDIRVRLVKGAYLEPKEVAHQGMTDVDEAYFEMSKLLLDDGIYPAFGTHDDCLIDRICAYAKEHDVDEGKFEFQMLYGVRRPLQSDLQKAGYNVRVYVPYGTSWYPYFTRRLAERPANLLFFIRSLFGK